MLGAAHVGVLRALEEHEIEVEYISGTSIGAFVGAFYAFGIGWKDIGEIAAELKWMDITQIALSQFGLLSNEKMAGLIKKYIGEKNIEDAEIPLAMVSTDTVSGDRIVLRKGPVAEAVMASTAVPGIFKPVETDGKLLVDGGIVENIPINTVREMGAEYVIGVDLNTKHSHRKPENILDILLNSFHFIFMAAAKYQTEAADLLIQPDLKGYDWTDVEQVEDLMELGYEEAKKALKKARR